MKKLTPEEAVALANEHSTKVFIIDQQQRIHDLTRERDTALAKCAEMRKVLKVCDATNYSGWWYNLSKHALSGDCGRGYFHARELDRTIELLTDLWEVCAGIPDGKLWKRFISEEIDRLAELKEGK